MTQTARWVALCESVQNNFERRSETSTTAFAFNLTMVEIDEAFRNGQSQSKSAELSCYRRICLFKWLKQRRQARGLDSTPGVGDFEMKAFCFVVKRADGDLSAFRSELYRVVD